MHTEENCFDTIGGAWEKWNDSTWHSFNNSWQFETDLALFPVLSDGVLLSTTSIEQSNKINIYPNPTNNILYINSLNQFNEYSVYDNSGKIILHKNTCGIKNLQIDFSFLTNGIYYLKFVGTDNIQFKKFAVAN